MAKARKSSRGKNPAYDDDKYEVRLKAPTREALARFLRGRPYDVGHGHADPDGGVEATLYLTQAQIDELRDEQADLEVGKNLSAVGRERQKEVGKGDRFKGGKVPPKGLGTKTQEPTPNAPNRKPRK